MIDTVANPLRKIPVKFLGQEEIGQSAVLCVEQVHIPHGLVDHVVVFRLQLRAAVDKQQLDERIEKGDVAFRRLKSEGIDARAVFADAVYSSAVQLDDALIAAADVEDVREPAIFLLQGDGQVP